MKSTHQYNLENNIFQVKYIKGGRNSRNHHFLPECFASFYQNALRLFTRMHCAFYQSLLRHEQHEVETLLWWRPFLAWIAVETG